MNFFLGFFFPRSLGSLGQKFFFGFLWVFSGFKNRVVGGGWNFLFLFFFYFFFSLLKLPFLFFLIQTIIFWLLPFGGETLFKINLIF